MGSIGDRLDGRYNGLGEATLTCANDPNHTIGPGEYFSVNAAGNPVCRADKPFELVAES